MARDPLNLTDDKLDALRKHFHDPEESLVGILGQNYLQSLLAGHGLSRSLVLISNKRLYQYGVSYVKEVNFSKRRGNRTVNVEAIDGIGVEEHRTGKCSAFIMLGAGIGLALLTGVNTGSGILMTVMGWTGSAVLCLFGLLTLLLGLMLDGKFLVVHFGGDTLAVPCKWYSQSEIDEFQRRVSIEKDRHRQQRSNQAGISETSPQPRQSTADKLKELKALLDDELISQQDYDDLRQQLLTKLTQVDN